RQAEARGLRFYRSRRTPPPSAFSAAWASDDANGENIGAIAPMFSPLAVRWLGRRVEAVPFGAGVLCGFGGRAVRGPLVVDDFGPDRFQGLDVAAGAAVGRLGAIAVQAGGKRLEIVHRAVRLGEPPANEGGAVHLGRDEVHVCHAWLGFD